MTNSSKIFVTIFNLEILFNFSVKVMCFTKVHKNMECNTKFALREGLKIYFEISVFSEKICYISELTKTSIKLNHFKIGKRNFVRS